MLTQNIIFSKEGDNWFRRNKSILFMKEKDEELDEMMNYFKTSRLKPKKILEIGCANGWRLNKMFWLHQANYYGLDPSALAIKHGQNNFKNIKIRRGFSHDLGAYKNNYFDLVIVSFVFHWLDRSKLIKTISEIDRVLANFGHLIIQDFDPVRACKIPYHHLPNKKVFTYKQPYWNIFTATNLYNLIYSKKFKYDLTKKVDDQNFYRLAILEKRTDSNYPLVNLH